MLNPFKFLRNRKVGLALGSGGAKGLSHISVIEYLEGLQIPIDMIAGSSIGAVVGAVYLCGNLRKMKDDMLSFSKKDFLSAVDMTIPKSGFIKGDNFKKFLTKYIPADRKIEELPKPLAIVATDYYTGKPVIFRKGNIIEAVRASVSIPGVIIPAVYGDTFLLDGGVSNPLPIDVVKDMGAGFTVAVNLHPGLKVTKIEKYVKSGAEKIGLNIFREDIHYADEDKKNEEKKVSVEDINNLSPEKRIQAKLKSKIDNWLVRKKEKKEQQDIYPTIFEVMFQSIDIMEYVNTQNMLKYHSPTVLIEPALLQTGTLSFNDAKNIFAVGYAASAEKKFELQRKIRLWI